MSNSSAVVSAVEKQVKDIIENANMQIPMLVNDMIDTKLVAVSNDIVKNMIRRVIAVESLVTNMSSSSGTNPQQSHSGDKSRKVILEYTAVNNMKVMGSQGVKYKEWDEKLVNLLSQLRVGSREVMIWIKESKDKKIEKSDYEAKSFGLTYIEFNEELYSLLKEKTEGEAAEKVSQGNKGEGIEAYRRLNHWFSVLGGLDMTSKRASVIRPTPPTREDQVILYVESWERDGREIELYDEDSEKLPVKYKIAAMKCLLIGEIKSYVERKEWDVYDKLKEEIMRWGLRRRAEQRQLGGSMEIDQVKEGEHPEDWSKEEDDTNNEEGWWVVNNSGEINWVGNKGKGKGGKKGSQRFTPYAGKGGPTDRFGYPFSQN